MTADKRYLSLTANTIMTNLTNHFQRTRLMTQSSDNHYSLDSEGDFRSGCRNVRHQQQFFKFSELPSPGRPHYTNYWILLGSNQLLCRVQCLLNQTKRRDTILQNLRKIKTVTVVIYSIEWISIKFCKDSWLFIKNNFIFQTLLVWRDYKLVTNKFLCFDLQLNYTKVQAGYLSTVFEIGGVLGTAMLGVFVKRY